MMKSFKYALLVGASLMLATPSFAASEGIRLGSESGASVTEAMKFATAIIGFPVLDITSVPAHSIVALEQQFIRLETENENVIKADVKHRLTEIEQAIKLDKLKQKAYNPVDYKYEQKDPREDRFRLLSQKRVNPKDEMKESWPAIKDGFIEAKEGSEIEKEGKTSTVELTKDQQKQWTSGAGSLAKKTDYQLKRDYIEQEQSIRMLAQTLVVKQNVFEKLKKLEEELDKHYKNTDVPGNLKGAGTVNATMGGEGKNAYSDYNKALREYAYQSLIYDQLLSMEQQILGMRLQTRGGIFGQGLQVISDDLETRGIDE